MGKAIRTVDQAHAAIFKLMPDCSLFLHANFHDHKSEHFRSHDLELRAHLISSKRKIDITITAATPAKLVTEVIKALSEPSPLGRSEILYPEQVDDAIPYGLPEPVVRRLPNNSVRRIEHRQEILNLTDQRKEII